MGERHDPSLFTDDGGAIYMLWQHTMIAPLSKDLTEYAAEPVRIDHTGTRLGPDGIPISRIGNEDVTIVPLDVQILSNGEVFIRAKDPAYANPGPDESSCINLRN